MACVDGVTAFTAQNNIIRCTCRDHVSTTFIHFSGDDGINVIGEEVSVIQVINTTVISNDDIATIQLANTDVFTYLSSDDI